MSRAIQGAAALLACAVACAVAGCGTTATPQPPSLNLPERVTDLEAVRAGNTVTLTWTMPKRNTDKILLKGKIDAEICRKQGSDSDASVTLCEPAGHVELDPAAVGRFSEALPAALTTGGARQLTYFVELKNHNGRSAGLSNPGVVVAGEAPAPVEGLTAEVRKSGVVLHWAAGDAQDAIRLHRTLVSPPQEEKHEGPLSAPREPATQDLLVEHDKGVALDKDIHFGETYEYRAQRVARLQAGGQMRELAGAESAAVRVEAKDVFPPAIPTGLAAVATEATDGVPASIDLSWQPDTEADVAGYVVYRREGQGAWQRISGAQPVVGPAFHDAAVQAGHTYSYAVSAMDARGNESARSSEASETVPNP